MKRYHRIVEIDHFDYFRGWQDAEVRAPHSFGIRTVVYGPNGSGKSTLASIFDAVEQAQAGDEADPRLDRIQVELTNGDKVTKHRGASALPRTIVFGREYIDRNLRQALDDDGVGAPMFSLGEGRAELTDDIQRVTKELESAQRADSDAREAVTKAKSNEQKIVDQIRKDVVEKLSAFHPHRFHLTMYKRQAARDLMREHLDAEPLSSEGLNEQLEVLRTDPDELPRQVIFEQLPSIPARLREELSRFVEREVVSEIIDRLAEAPPLANWAQRGLELHEPGDDCGFCGSTVTQAQVTRLQAHFDDSYRDLQQTADRLGDELERLADGIETASAQLERLENEGGSVARWVRERGDDLRADADSHATWVSKAREIVGERRRDPLRLDSWEVPEPPASSTWQALSTHVDQENQRRRELSANIDSAKKQATTAVLRHIAATHQSEYDEAHEALSQASQRPESTGAHVSELEEKLEELQSQERAQRRDARKVAKDLSEDLSRYLGFRGLSVYYDEEEDPAGFRFLRNNEPCTGLSEGERGAIALLYFLRRLESDEFLQPNPDGDEPINTLPECCVVIDDPVSSFDNDTLLTAYTYLRDRFTSKTGQTGIPCAQLIVLTHNFHFMRLWMVDYSKKVQHDESRAKKMGKPRHTLPDRSATFLDLRPTLKPGDPLRRVSHLRDIGGSRASRSEYHLLFEEVCHAYEDGDHARLLLAGNAARRMLESFAYWKWPHGNQFAPTVRELGQHHGIPDPVIENVVQTTNDVSHRLEIGMHNDQYVGDVTEALRSVLWFMRQCDEEHFSRMCTAQNVRPPELGPMLKPAETP